MRGSALRGTDVVRVAIESRLAVALREPRELPIAVSPPEMEVKRRRGVAAHIPEVQQVETSAANMSRKCIYDMYSVDSFHHRPKFKDRVGVHAPVK